MIKRKAYYTVEKVMNDYKIPILVGLRRVGKTTILKQIEEEYSNSEIFRIDAFEFKKMTDIELVGYLDQKISSENIEVLLFDEIQERKTWDSLLKELFDKYMYDKKIKIVATGSSSISFENRDLGVDRMKKVAISTLDFSEYIELTGKEKNHNTFEKYLGFGAFPEYSLKEVNSFTDLLASTLMPILNNDIPSEYKVDSGNIVRLLSEIASLTNGEFTKTKSSIRTGISINQINNYIDILEKAHIVKVVHQINEKGEQPRYPKIKVYINPHFHLWMLSLTFDQLDNKRKGHIIESYWLFAVSQGEEFYNRFFYLKDKSNNEIDFVTMTNVVGQAHFDSLHEFKYSDKALTENYHLMKITKSNKKVVWCKQDDKKGLIEFKNIINL